MKTFFKYCFGAILVFTFLSFMWGTGNSGQTSLGEYFTIVQDTSVKDTTRELPYPFKDREGDKYTSRYDDSPFYLKDPSNVQSKIEYDPATKRYNIHETIGKQFYRNPSYMTLDEFLKNEYSKSTKNYWRKKAGEEGGLGQKKPFAPKIHVGGEVFDRIFGGNTVEIKPQGSAELTFGWNTNRNNNPNLPEKQRKVSTFDFREKIQLNVIASIGDKLKLTTNYNTEATFDFENQMKLEYTGYEDEIIKKIEAGNVNLPLSSSLITGSQSLFGIKTQLQFGRLTVTSIFSQQKGRTSTVETSGGAQISTFNIQADQYEANKHYFLSQYFYNNYDRFLSELPVIKSPVNITNVEVWITSAPQNADKENRNILSFMDLGERDPFQTTSPDVGYNPANPEYPDNSANGLYNNLVTKYSNYRDFIQGNAIQIPGLEVSRDFEKLENARKLSANEFTVNARLGYITLNTPLKNDDVLAVAFEYTIGSKVYRVGELTAGGVEAPKALFLKLLRGKTINTRLPIWKLMMKNIYNINAYQVSSKDFKLDVLYLDNSIGSNINYIPEGRIKGVPLIRVVNLDRLNAFQNPQPDGVFDYVEGFTINSTNGRIIFPVTEPFGSYLRQQIQDPAIAKKYVFDTLYTSTQATAKQILSLNKFSLSGSYQSASSAEISLNAINIPQGSVVVTAGGQRLEEGKDYQVDYTLGRVRITNEGILQSGVPIKISTESNALFSIQTKTLMGSRFDYMVSKDLNLGGTVLRLTERPLTKKVNINEEPISNTIWGLDGNYRTDSRFLTKLVDKIPFIDTKEMSSVTLSAEYAHLVPGHASAIGKEGISYIDDFEGSKTPLDMTTPQMWFLASTPQGQPALFPEGVSSYNNNLIVGTKRAKLAWNRIDNIFNKGGADAPDNIDDEERSRHYVREIPETEIFNRQPVNGQTNSIFTLNLNYYPNERGPYNYDVKGLSPEGNLLNPKSRWGGIMRRVETTDFDAANIEFIEIWMMDPFLTDRSSSGGELYFNIGSISEDVLRDNKKSVENGLPTGGQANLTTRTAWGKMATIQPVSLAFENDEAARALQDIGLDGLNDAEERDHFRAYLDSVRTYAGTQAYNRIASDPSGDNFHHYKGEDLDQRNAGILERYKNFNGPEGNSNISAGNAASYQPDNEDVNRDNTLDLSESYFQYKIVLKPEMMTQIGRNHITSIVNTRTQVLANGQTKNVTWYQFRIPIRKPEQIIGGIEDFRSIRFIRMFFKGFEDTIICRFAKLQFIRGEWRRYTESLLSPGEYLGGNDNFDKTVFDVTTINLEEDGNRKGIPYVLPPNIDQEVLVGQTTLQRLNEQSLLLKVCGLSDGDSRAAFKPVQFDIRNYKKLRMFIHAQKINPGDVFNRGDLTCFIRLGSDFTDNYYEIEVPLVPTLDGSRSAEAIWPAENELEIELEKLQYVKNLRNRAMLQPGSSVNLNTVYPPAPFISGNNRITIKGSPNLSNVRTVMIGIRNPKQVGTESLDDGQEKCAEVWVNELRMTDFDEAGGWAATARVSTKLADFATVNLSGSKSTPGWGSIEQKLNERKRADITSYDVNSSVELGKFFPEKTGIKLPMFVGYSHSLTIPQFNPLDPDVKLKPYLESIDDKRIRDSLENITTDLTERKSLNFTNVRKVKTGTTKSHFYDVENLNFTYAYTQMFQRNINIESNLLETYRGAVGYNYSVVPKSITPFSKLKLKSRYLRPVTDFNFSYAPSSLSFHMDVDRQFGKTMQRSVVGQAPIAPTYNKIFSMNRTYGVNYDLTKSVKIDFNAVNNSAIDEPAGDIDTQAKRDTIKNNLLGGGRTTRYHHTLNVNYAVPLNKFPLTDWINLSVRYGMEYDWSSGPRFFRYANTIQNSSSTQFNMPLSLTNLYNKVSYFQKLNQKKGGQKESAVSMKKPVKTPVDTVKTKKDGKEKDKKEQESGMKIYDYAFKLLMSLKTLSVNYTLTRGTLLPGYDEPTHILGQTYNASSAFPSGGPATNAPGTGFILGQQRDVDDPENIRFVAAKRGWLIQDPTLNNSFVQTNVRNLQIRGNMEPASGLRIDLNASRNYSLEHREIFRWDTLTGNYGSFQPQQTGNFSISFLSIRTAFIKDDENHVSETFEKLRNYRYMIARRLAAENTNPAYVPVPDSSGYPFGYGSTSQDVLIPSFIAAYSGSDPSKSKLNPFAILPLPNWRVTFDGLSRIKFFQKYFTSVVLGHGYRSSFSVNTFLSNILYRADRNGNPLDTNQIGNFIPRYNIGQVTISEQFSPLGSIDITWKNNLLTRVEFKRDRTVSLAMSSNQVNEVRGQEYIVGVGYRIKEFKVPFKIRKKQVALKNDLDLKTDFIYRRSSTIIRKVVEGTNQPSSGTNIMIIKAYADYIVNERFNIRLFYERQITIPVVSISFPTSNTQAGISMRFTLTQ